MDLISDFYNAYIGPLLGETIAGTCTKTSSMASLEQNDTLDAANKYYTVYCDALNFISNTNDALVEPAGLELRQEILAPASEAAAALNALLRQASSAEDAIIKTLEELTQ